MQFRLMSLEARKFVDLVRGVAAGIERLADGQSPDYAPMPEPWQSDVHYACAMLRGGASDYENTQPVPIQSARSAAADSVAQHSGDSYDGPGGEPGGLPANPG